MQAFNDVFRRIYRIHSHAPILMILTKIEAAMGKPVLAVDDSAYSNVTDEEE